MSASSIQSLPADHFVKIHQFTKSVHHDQYSAIDPTSSKLSQNGKTVIITGASQGIGKAIALAFAKADAARIALVSRSVEKLEATKQELRELNPSIDVLVLPMDTTSEDQAAHLEETIKARFGVPDVLVNVAGLWSSSDILGDSKPAEWWADFEVNTKGSYLMSRAFLRLVGLEREASIVNVGTWGMLTAGPVGTSYAISKLAMARMSEAIPSAYPKISSITYHPGMTRTEMAETHPETLNFCGDTVELAAGVALYLASPQARFLSGRYMSANWDVDELEARKDLIIEDDLLKMDLRGEFGSANATDLTYTTILYPLKEGAKFDLDYFLNKHLPLAMKHWERHGLLGYDVTELNAAGGQDLKYRVQCTLKWDNPTCMEKAMQGVDGEIVCGDVPNFTSVPGVTLTGQVKRRK